MTKPKFKKFGKKGHRIFKNVGGFGDNTKFVQWNNGKFFVLVSDGRTVEDKYLTEAIVEKWVKEGGWEEL